jgi:hypothetical protein
MVTSAYLPCDLDDPPPTQELKDIVSNSGKDPIIGCDASAHHILQGSTDNNSRENYWNT